MGLSVKIFKNVFCKGVEMPDSYEEGRAFKAVQIDESFYPRSSDLKKGQYYIALDSIDNPLSYPYSLHNCFRRELMRMTGTSVFQWENGKLPETADFHEFLEFADNDGCISWTTSKEIFKDLDIYHTRAMKHKPELMDQASFINIYNAWRDIFRIGSAPQNVVVYS